MKALKNEGCNFLCAPKFLLHIDYDYYNLVYKVNGGLLLLLSAIFSDRGKFSSPNFDFGFIYLTEWPTAIKCYYLVLRRKQ